VSNIANLVAFDGAATPVSHTLIPVSVTRSKDEVVAIWREQVTTLPIYAQIQQTTRLKRLSSGIWKPVSRTEVPVIETVSGQNAAGYTAVPKVAYTNTMETNGFFHERSSIAERRLVRQLHVNINNGITTTVTPTTTGPAPELFDTLVSAT